MKYSIKLLAMIGAVLVLTSVAWSQASISLERVNGLAEPGVLETGQQIFFTFRVQNNNAEYAIGVTSGFRVYSPDGAEWTTTILDTTPEMGRGEFPMGVYLTDFSVTGSGADTVGLLGLGENIGLPSGLSPFYDDLGLILQIGPIPRESRGLTICLDSSFYFNGGHWKWILQTPSEIIPAWDGPHCYTIACCDFMGDVNDDGIPAPDISDLIALVTYMFQGGEEPFCPKVMDVDGSGGIPDIGDLTYLVRFMFQEGPDLLPCPFQPTAKPPSDNKPSR